MKRTRIGLYNTAVWFPESAAQWRRLSRKLASMDPDLPDCAGRTVFATGRLAGDSAVAHLVFHVDPATAASLADLADTCAHEASHGAADIMDWIGHEDGGEPLAYLVGYLTGWLFSVVDRTGLA